jgi:hypothetical protein
MIEGSKRATDIVLDRMKIALVGEPKIGKDFLANTAPGKLYTFDFDGRFEALQKHPNRSNIEGKTYFDINALEPHAWTEFESDVAEFQQMKKAGETIPTWFIISSMQFVSDAAENWILYNNPGMRTEVTEVRIDKKKGTMGSGKVIAYRSFGWEPYNTIIDCIRNNIDALMSIGNLICCFHESPEKDKTLSTPANPVYTGKLSVAPANLQKLLPLFNDMWRVVVVNNTRKVITDCSDYKFTGATSLLLDSEEEADITKMLEKHRTRLTQ